MDQHETDEAADDAFDDALNEATHAAIAEFEYLGLPDEGTDQRTAILHRINDALTEIMAEYLKPVA